MTREIGSKKTLVDWSESALEDLFFSLLSTLQTSTVVLIDGLDEFDQDVRPLRLFALLKKISSCSMVKLCVSSRPMPGLDQQLSSAKNLRLQDLTQRDIKKYANDVLQEEVGFQASEVGNEQIKELVVEIDRKAEGVFLWVKYAVHSIGEGISGMDDFLTLMGRLSELPKGMNELYEHIWHRHENYNSRHREEGAMFFHCARLLPLSLFELTVMMDSALWQHYREGATPIDTKLINRKCAQMERKLRIRTAGLLICQHRHARYPGNAHITYLHPTVYDFLYGTEQGRMIVALPDVRTLNLSQRRIYALVASLLQGHWRLQWRESGHDMRPNGSLGRD